MVTPQPVVYTPQLTLVNMLAVLFIAYKLAGLIDWSWWVVLAPIWGEVLFVFVAALVKEAIK